MRTSVLSLLLGAVVLSGCGASVPGFGGAATSPVVAVPAVAMPDDPLARFAATATPGRSGTVDGQPARLVRSYNAASGRECREILLGSGASERTAVACRTPEGGFASARPLLRGSAR